MTFRPVHFICVLLICSPLFAVWYSTGINHEEPVLRLWNGNKTPIRQAYEREVLDAALAATKAIYGDIPVVEDRQDFSDPNDEAAVFRTGGYDIFGTVAGNPKLEKEKKYLVPVSIMKGLLGYRILVTRAEDRERFDAIASIDDLKKYTVGVPDFWAELSLFGSNHLPTNGDSSFDSLFADLAKGAFDYTTFGVNEVESIFDEHATNLGSLQLNDHLMIYYPMPVVFYVTPRNPALARRVADGLEIITQNGVLDAIFNRYFGEYIARLDLQRRHMIVLDNPLLPHELDNFSPDIL